MENTTIGLILSAIATVFAAISCLNSIKKKKKPKKLLFKEKSYIEQRINPSSAEFFTDKKNVFVAKSILTITNKGSEEITSEDLSNDDDIHTPIYIKFPSNSYIRDTTIIKRDKGAIGVRFSRSEDDNNEAALTWEKLKEKKGFTIELVTEYYENEDSKNFTLPTIKIPSSQISSKITHFKQEHKHDDAQLFSHICYTILIMAFSCFSLVFFFRPQYIPVNCTIQTKQIENCEIVNNSYYGTLYSEKKFVYDDITINPTSFFLQDTTMIRLIIDREEQCPECVNDSNDRSRFRHWMFISIGLCIIISIISYYLYFDESNYQIRN